MTTSDKRGDNCPSSGALSADNDPFVKAFEEGRKKPLPRWQSRVLYVFPGGIPLIDERGLFDDKDTDD